MGSTRAGRQLPSAINYWTAAPFDHGKVREEVRQKRNPLLFDRLAGERREYPPHREPLVGKEVEGPAKQRPRLPATSPGNSKSEIRSIKCQQMSPDSDCILVPATEQHLGCLRIDVSLSNWSYVKSPTDYSTIRRPTPRKRPAPPSICDVAESGVLPRLEVHSFAAHRFPICVSLHLHTARLSQLPSVLTT